MALYHYCVEISKSTAGFKYVQKVDSLVELNPENFLYNNYKDFICHELLVQHDWKLNKEEFVILSLTKVAD